MLTLAKDLLRPLYRRSGAARAVSAWRRRPQRFEHERANYMRSHATARKSPSADPALASLVERGFVVVPALHDVLLVRHLHDRLRDIMERIRHGQRDSGWDLVIYPEDGIYRLRRVEAILPEASALLDNSRAAAIVKSYLAAPFRTVDNYVDYKPDFVHDSTTIPHLDSWKSQVKIFTPLNEIGDANAPFVYWAHTHRDLAWRRRFDYAIWSGDYVGSAGLVPPHVLRDQAAIGGPDAPRETIVTAKAGDVIIADTRGIHRASDLRDGYRLQIVQKFNV
jgi:hypothetical protein